MLPGIFAKAATWQPPADWLCIEAIEMHTGGEPLRVLLAGLPEIVGGTVLEKRRYFRDHLDWLRTALVWEPRGHADMYAAVVSPSVDADADVFFLHNEGYSTMCGHAIIALTTLAAELDVQAAPALAPSRTVTIRYRVPAGIVEGRAVIDAAGSKTISFTNVPSFAYALDLQIDIPGVGPISLDIGYGGAFYAVVEAEQAGVSLALESSAALIDLGRRIKKAVMGACVIEHPFERDLSFLYGTIFTGPATSPLNHSRNVCVFADGEIDRSPTGSGVSARIAIEVARGRIPLGSTISIESIVGSAFTVRALERAVVGKYPAVVPEVSGTAFITGRSKFWIDPADPFRTGFLIR